MFETALFYVRHDSRISVTVNTYFAGHVSGADVCHEFSNAASHYP